MYKKFSIEEIKNVKNNFIPNLYSIIKKEKCQWINDLVKHIFKEGNDVYYFEKWNPFFRFSQNNQTLEIIDEQERIQLSLPINDKSQLQNLLKTYIFTRFNIYRNIVNPVPATYSFSIKEMFLDKPNIQLYQ